MALALLVYPTHALAQCPSTNSCSSATTTFVWANSGSGQTAEFYGASVGGPVLYVTNTSTGSAGYFYSNNVANGVAVVAGSIAGPGVFGSTAATAQQGWAAVYGDSGATAGVWGKSSYANGVHGRSYGELASGVYGENLNYGYGVAGRTTYTGIAVFGDNPSTAGWSGYFNGKVAVLGWLQKSGGGFTIDHPLDPKNKTLSHSFVESPDMKNFYDGIVTLDAVGEAWVELPEWFSTLNKDFRYQLTPLRAHSDLFVAEELSGSRFKIAGGKPKQRVSWAVTGIRNDAWANKNRMVVEQLKPDDERGTYLNPEAFGAPSSLGVAARKLPAAKMPQPRSQPKFDPPQK